MMLIIESTNIVVADFCCRMRLCDNKPLKPQAKCHPVNWIRVQYSPGAITLWVRPGQGKSSRSSSFIEFIWEVHYCPYGVAIISWLFTAMGSPCDNVKMYSRSFGSNCNCYINYSKHSFSCKLCSSQCLLRSITKLRFWWLELCSLISICHDNVPAYSTFH